jgi:hypothetical protein
VALFDRVKDTLTPADRRALEVPIGVAADDAATDAWLEREGGKGGAPLVDRVGLDDTLSAQQRLIIGAKIAVRESAEESRRVATVKGLDDRRAAATTAMATQPSLYRTGTLAGLAGAYDSAGAPEQAAEMRRLALLEPFFRSFAQLGGAAQQRHLETLAGPERAMAETILRHQTDAFARDPYAAGTALYPEVGPPLPEEDAEGRLQQVRMIEARRGMPVSTHTGEGATMSDAVDETLEPGRQYAQASNATAVQGRSGTAAIGEPLPGRRQLDAYISADREAQRLKAEEKGQEKPEPPNRRPAAGNTGPLGRLRGALSSKSRKVRQPNRLQVRRSTKPPRPKSRQSWPTKPREVRGTFVDTSRPMTWRSRKRSSVGPVFTRCFAMANAFPTRSRQPDMSWRPSTISRR